MFKKITLVLTFGLTSILSYAQPANDACAGALPINPSNGCVNGTTVLAADNWVGAVGCQGGGTHPDVWYTFTATSASLDYTVLTSGAWTGDIEFVLAEATGPCTGLGIAGSDCGPSVLTGTVNGLQPGTLYYITISNENTGTEGDFQLCINNYNPPVVSGQDCPTSAILCDDSQVSQTTSSAGFGVQEITTSNTCWGSGGERQSKWFQFTIGCSGTLEFNINPAVSNDDYDWALFDITTAGCPTTASATPSAVACNWSGCRGSTGISTCPDIANDEPGAVSSGSGCFGGPAAWENVVINATAGQTYALLVDNFSSSNSGFTLTWGGACGGGTALIGPDAAFSFTNPACGVYDFSKTCQTTNSTFLWTFGDGTTSTAQNPSHTYTTTGNYIVTLEVTDALGCTTTSSVNITVNFPVATGTPNPTEVCSGNAVNIALTSNIGGTTWEWSAIPNGNVTGETTTTQTTSTINDALTLTGAGPELVQYTVTPTAAGCVGPPITVDVTVTPQPDIDPISNVTACDSYVLPNLTGTLTGNEAYYTGAGGTGTQYAEGATINYADFPGYPVTLYAYDSTMSTPTCFDEETFQLTIVQSPILDPITNLANCDSVQLSAISGTFLTGNQAYYTGPNGTGTQYNAGDWISTSLTLYAYDATATSPVCFDEVSFTVTITAGPTTGITPNPAEICAGLNLALNGNTSGGSGTYTTHTWSGAGAGSLTPLNTPTTTFNNAIPGAYEIIYTVVDDAGCSGADTISVTVHPNPTANVTPDPANVCAGVDLGLNGNPAGGSGVYTSHAWTNTGAGSLNATNIVNPIFNNATGGTYDLTYTVIDDNGCTATDDITVNVWDNPVIASDTTTPSGCNLTDGSIQVTLTSGATPNGTVSWTGTTSGGPQAMTLPDDITGLGAGSYNVTFTDANGCISNVTSEVLINPGAPVINFIPDTTACNVDYTLDYSMITGTNLTAGVGFYYNSGGSSPILDDTVFTAPTNITVYAYDSNGACDVELSFTITINENPTVNITPNPGTVCVGEDLQMNGNPTGGSGVYTSHSWTNSGAGSLDNTTIPNPIFNTTTAGIYDLDYTVIDNNGCTATDIVSVTVNAAPMMNITTDSPICLGETLNLTEDAGDGTSWNWTSLNGSAVIATPSNASTAATGVTNGEIFQVVVGDANGCTDSITTTVTVNPAPNAGAINNGPICAGETVTLTENGGAATTWNWTSLNGSAVINTPSAGTTTATGVTNGEVFQVVISDASGCTDSITTTVTVNPTPNVAAINSGPICDGETIILTENGGAATTWNWTSLNGSAAINTPSTGTTTATGVTNGEIFQVVISDASGCTDSITTTVTVNPTPNVAAINDGPICDGTTVTLTENGGVATSWNWTSLNGTAAINSPGTAATTATGVTDGEIFQVVISDAIGCTDSITTTVTVNPNPTASILPNPAEVCAGDVLAMDGNPSGGSGVYTTHDWTGAGAGSLDATNNQTPNFSNATGGSYNLIYTVTDNNGCTATSTIDLTVFDTPVIDPIADTAVCADFTFSAITGTNVTGNASYWTGMGGTGTEYLVGDSYSTAGTITLYAFDGANGCSSEEPFNLTVNVLPTVSAISGGATYCQGDAINNILVDVAGQSSWTINYTLDGTPQQATGATSPIDLGNAPGVYVLQSIDDAVCSNSATGTETIVVNPIPAAPTAGTSGEFCSTATLDPLTASGSGGTFTWYDDATLTGVLATTAVYEPTNTVGTTSYYVTETLNGCEGPASEVIITITVCDIIVPTAFTPGDDNAHDVWEIENLTNAYPNHVVRIFNRWGSQLYESPQGGYDTQKWDGSYNGQLLPVGSYYYIIEFNDEEGGSAKGTVTIMK